MSDQQPRKLLRCIIKEEFLELTGDAVSAAILNQMIFWAELVNKSDQKILNEIAAYEKIGNLSEAAKLKQQLKHGWFWKAASEMSDEIMISTRATVSRKMAQLVKLKFIDSRPNPDPNYVTKYYKVNLAYIQSELHKKGFSLEGYTLPPDPKSTYSIAQNEQYQIYGVAQNEQGVAQNEQGSAHTEQGVAQNEQVSIIQSLDLQSSGLQSQSLEEEVYTGSDPLILKLLNISQKNTLSLQHETFLQNLTKYSIPDEMATQVIDHMATNGQDINHYSVDAINKTFSEFAKRSGTQNEVKVFPRWFATTVGNKQFEVDQAQAREDEKKREDEQFQKRLDKYKSHGETLGAAASEFH